MKERPHFHCYNAVFSCVITHCPVILTPVFHLMDKMSSMSCCVTEPDVSSHHFHIWQKSAIDWGYHHRKQVPSANWVCRQDTLKRKLRGCGGGVSWIWHTHSLYQKIQISSLNHFEGGWVWVFRASVLLTELRAWCPYCSVNNLLHWHWKLQYLVSESTLLFVTQWDLVSCCGFEATWHWMLGCLVTVYSTEI